MNLNASVRAKTGQGYLFLRHRSPADLSDILREEASLFFRPAGRPDLKFLLPRATLAQITERISGVTGHPTSTTSADSRSERQRWRRRFPAGNARSATGRPPCQVRLLPQQSHCLRTKKSGRFQKMIRISPEYRPCESLLQGSRPSRHGHLIPAVSCLAHCLLIRHKRLDFLIFSC